MVIEKHLHCGDCGMVQLRPVHSSYCYTDYCGTLYCLILITRRVTNHVTIDSIAIQFDR